MSKNENFLFIILSQFHCHCHSHHYKYSVNSFTPSAVIKHHCLPVLFFFFFGSLMFYCTNSNVWYIWYAHSQRPTKCTSSIFSPFFYLHPTIIFVRSKVLYIDFVTFKIESPAEWFEIAFSIFLHIFSSSVSSSIVFFVSATRIHF